jgi:GNAT superfamily N-acetyltransferase
VNGELELRDGRTVQVRAVEAEDVDRLRRLFFRLSPATVHLRFFQPVKTPSERMLRHLAGVDHDRREALAAVYDDEIVAVARFDRWDGRNAAEVAILVQDDWQATGLGTLLMNELAAEARDHGLTEFTATVLGENRRALSLLHHLSHDSRVHLDHGEWELSIPI